jgi:hypothetical protein
MKKILFLSLFLNVLFLFILVVPIIYSYSLSNYIKQKEILRISSPDYKVDAVIIEVDGGATSALIHAIYVVKKGEPIFWKKDYCYKRVFQGRSLRNLKIKWIEDQFLEINHLSGNVDYFKDNIGFLLNQDSKPYEIDISLEQKE